MPDVPAYGYRVLTVAQAKLEEHAEISSTWRRESAVRENVMHESMVRPALHMEPMLTLADREIRPEGGWSTAELGEWRVGPFVMEAEYRPEWAHGCYRLSLRISGSPPEDSYELRWRIELPWKRVKWRGESGGGFVTRGSSESGGNCLLGITAAVFSAGEGLCVADVDSTGRIDLAFLENGMCGLGGTTLRAASGGYGEKVPKEIRTLSVAATPETDGILEVFLLGTRMNYKEALKDQGGSRSWTYTFGVRGLDSTAEFDDAGLYRFACGFTYPGEIIAIETAAKLDDIPLKIECDRAILPLRLNRIDGRTELDLYDTKGANGTVALSGRLIRGARVLKADMLGRLGEPLSAAAFEIDGGTYSKIVIASEDGLSSVGSASGSENRPNPYGVPNVE